MHTSTLPRLYSRNPIFEHKTLSSHRLLLLSHAALYRLSLTNVQPKELLRGDEEDVRVRLPAPALEQPIVRAHDAALEAVKELAEMRGLKLKVAALRTRRERERHTVRV